MLLLGCLFDLRAKDSTTFSIGASINFHKQSQRYLAYNLSLGIKQSRNHLELGLSFINYPDSYLEGEVGAFINYARMLNKKSAIFDPYLNLHFLYYRRFSFNPPIRLPSFQAYIGYGVRLKITNQHQLSSDFNISNE